MQPSQIPRPVAAKNVGTRTGQPLDLRFYSERMGQPATLHDNETKQVEFVRATGIQSQRIYIYDGAQIGNTATTPPIKCVMIPDTAPLRIRRSG